MFPPSPLIIAKTYEFVNRKLIYFQLKYSAELFFYQKSRVSLQDTGGTMTPPAVFRRTLFPAESHSCAGKECEEEKKSELRRRNPDCHLDNGGA